MTWPARNYFRVPDSFMSVAGVLGASAFVVLMALCRRADREGICFPSVATICADTGLKESCVRERIGDLELNGLVTIIRSRTKTNLNAPNTYRLAASFVPQTTPPGHTTQLGVLRRRNTPRRRVDSSAPAALTPPPGRTQNQTIEPNKEPEGRESALQDDGQRALFEGAKADEVAHQVPQSLLLLIDAFNALGPSVVIPGNGARRDPPSKEILAGYRRAIKDPELRDVFADLPALMAAIRASRFVHQQGFFNLAWLFGKNRNGERVALKLMSGGYRDEQAGTSRTGQVGRLRGSVGPDHDDGGNKYRPVGVEEINIEAAAC